MDDFLSSALNEMRRKYAEKTADSKPQPTLTDDLRDWWEQMPDVQREPYYSMRFLKDTVGYPANMIGPALSELGWSKRRSWQKNKPFCRVWVPPTQYSETTGGKP